MILALTRALVIFSLLALTVYRTFEEYKGPGAAKAFINVILNWMTAALADAATLLGNAEAHMEPVVAAVVKAFQTAGGPLAEQIREPVEALTRGVIGEATSVLTSMGLSTPDRAQAAAATAMAQAFGFGVSSAGVTAAFESLLPKDANTWNAAGPILAEMAGFRNVADAVLDPLYENAFGRSLDYHYKSQFKPEYPREIDAVTWHARGLIGPEELREVFHYSGLKAKYEDPYLRSAFRSVSAFIVLEVMSSGVVDDSGLRSMLQFNGYRPGDIDHLISYAHWKTLEPYRQKALQNLINAYERGLYPNSEFSDLVSGFDLPPGAETLIHLEASARRLIQLTDIYRKSVTEAYKYGLISDAEYLPRMAAIGMGQADAEAHYAVDSIAKEGKALVTAEREAEHRIAREQAAAVRAALKQYDVGNLDAAELSAALLATGLDPAIAGFAVELAVARRQGKQLYVHGALVSRADAQELRDKVSALREQVVKKLVGPDAALADLQAFGIPEQNAKALVAKWSAQAYKELLPL